MRQKALAEGSFEKYREPTRRGIFLDEMDRVVRWMELRELIAPARDAMVLPPGAGRAGPFQLGSPTNQAISQPAQLPWRPTA